jgi:hypothetical protein
LAWARSRGRLRKLTKQREGCGHSTGTVVGKVVEMGPSQLGVAA